MSAEEPGSYGLNRFNVFPFVNFCQRAGERTALLEGSHPEAGFNRLREFLGEARELYPEIYRSEDYQIVDNYIVEATVSGSENLDLESLAEKTGWILKCVRNIRYGMNGYLDGKILRLQETYPQFKNPRPLVERFPQQERAILPQSVREDWDESAKCLEYSLVQAGSMLAFRAVEGMLKYYCWNLTGRRPEGEPEKPEAAVDGAPENSETGKAASAKVNRPKLSNKTSLKPWRWQEIIDYLEGKSSFDFSTDGPLAKAQTARNRLAHGALDPISVDAKTAKTYVDTAFQAIKVLAEDLASQGKALRVCANINLAFDTCLGYWLFDRYGGGVANIECRSDKEQSKQWYSYELSLGGKYSAIQDRCTAKTVFEDLVAWGCIPDADERDRIEPLVAAAANQPDDRGNEEDDLTIYGLVKEIKHSLKKEEARQYHQVKDLIDGSFKYSIPLTSVGLAALRDRYVIPP